jgi:hypothetical protein
MKTNIMSTEFRTPAERKKHLLAGLIFGLMVSLLMFSSVGCDKKKDKASSGYGYGYGGGYGGGYGAGPSMGAAIGSYQYGSLQIMLEFQAIGGVQPYGQPYNQSYGYNMSLTDYSGPAQIYGQMIVSQPVQCGYSQIPAGQYQLQSSQPAQMNRGFTSGVQLMAFGSGGQFPVQVSALSILRSYSYGGYDELVGIFSINGCSIYVQGQ